MSTIATTTLAAPACEWCTELDRKYTFLTPPLQETSPRTQSSDRQPGDFTVGTAGSCCRAREKVEGREHTGPAEPASNRSLRHPQPGPTAEDAHPNPATRNTATSRNMWVRDRDHLLDTHPHPPISIQV